MIIQIPIYIYIYTVYIYIYIYMYIYMYIYIYIYIYNIILRVGATGCKICHTRLGLITISTFILYYSFFQVFLFQYLTTVLHCSLIKIIIQELRKIDSISVHLSLLGG